MDTFSVEVANLIKLHEGFGSKAYRDSEGNWTLGYGRNLDSNPLTGKEVSVLLLTPLTVGQAEYLLDNDITYTIGWLSTYNWWNNLTNNRKACLIDMGFNLGKDGFQKFILMISALEAGNYDEAANQMKNSSWASIVGKRAQDDIMLMQKG